MKKISFTLIEILVAVTIISILSGVGLANYINFNLVKQLESNADKFVDVLYLARSKTISGDKSSCVNFFGYRVNISSSDSYSLRSCCNLECTNFVNIITPIPKLFSSSNDLSFENTGHFHFNVLEGKNIGTLTSIRLKSTALNKCITINVNSVTGLINKNPIADCP